VNDVERVKVLDRPNGTSARHHPTRRCPQCGTAADWQGNPHRPFCSLPCRLIDLGIWLDERYRIPGEPVPTEGAHDHGTPPGPG
jgi:endogenous inhibitor of DNA gyrase (YacG/DUF329 family)